VPPNRNPRDIPNYLWQSIVVTIVCCLPLGIPAIVYATRVNSCLLQGDEVGAAQASGKAKLWCWLALAGAVVAGMMYGGLLLLGILAES
jgi:hypothetical protein